MEAKAATKVLLVEDDDSFRLFTRMSFQRAGYEVVEAREGAEAIERALEHRPAAVVLDLWLPGIPGRDVLKVLRENADFAAVPIVVVSGVAEVKDREGLREDGADAVLEKPVPPPDIVAAVAGLLKDGRKGTKTSPRRLSGSGS